MTNELKLENENGSLENRELSINSNPRISNMETPPPTPPPTPIRNEPVSIYSHHSDELSHPSINNFINHYNDEILTRILDIKLESDKDDVADLDTFCNRVIQKKFKEAIKVNTVLPSSSDKKEFKLKVFQQTDPADIKKRIVDTISNPDIKIKKFIDSTIDSLLLSEMKKMERSTVSLHEKVFHKIVFKSKLCKRYFSTNYYNIEINLLSIKYL